MQEVSAMRRLITHVLCAAAAAGIALTTLGLAGAGSPATGAVRSPWPPSAYTKDYSGYMATGRSFRWVATTATVPAVTLPTGYSDVMSITLGNVSPNPRPFATMTVAAGGGTGSVSWGMNGTMTPLPISPAVGDQVGVNIYYDRNGHTSFSVTDYNQGITRVAQASTSHVVYNEARVVGAVPVTVPSPPADARLWAISGTRLTTYTGAHGNMKGPWQVTKLIQTDTGTATGTVITSPSALWNGYDSFGVWLRHH
jgi:hypothetical protein